MLLVGAGLLIKSFRACAMCRRVQSDHVLTMGDSNARV